jgi:hypothetical protein
MPRQGMASETWWSIGSNGAAPTHRNAMPVGAWTRDRNAIVPFALTGHGIGHGVSIITPGALTSSSADANALIRIRWPAKKTFVETTYAAFLQNAGLFFHVDSQGCTLGWYAMYLQRMD